MTGMVIIGGGLAGGRAARMLREEGYSGEITIVAAEPHYPYERPPLSKEVMQGKKTADVVFLRPDKWYDEQKITVRTATTATSLDTTAHEVTLSDGSRLAYDKLLLATGSRARTLPIPGHDLAGVHTLRTLDDMFALRAALEMGGKNLVLIGSGWIGMEVAASATELGNHVTILERGAAPLESVLGADLGGAFQAVHETHGVKFHMNASVESIEGDAHVTGVRVDGELVPADLVLVGVGAVPNVEIAQEAGIATEDGILTNAGFLTSVPDVYAAGDVANAMHPVVNRRLRSEHWSNAINQGKAAALAMLGNKVSYDEIPYFYTDQFELGVELSCYPHLMSQATPVIRGSIVDKKYIAFWLLDERVVAGMNVNIWDVNETIQKLIRGEQVVDVDRLTNPRIELESLVIA